MDYRRVEGKYQRYAFVMQLTLIGFLLLYFVSQAVLIVRHAETPPVETSMKKWFGAGKWMICEWDTLYGIGVGLPHDQSTPSFEHKQWETLTETVPVSKIPEEVNAIDGNPHNCSIIDLTAWKMPVPPLSFSLCNDAAKLVFIYVESGGIWERVRRQERSMFTQVKLTKRSHGDNSGFSTSFRDYFSASLSQEWTDPGFDFEYWCPNWIRFNTGGGGGRSALLVEIDEPLVMVTANLGVIPQLLSLFSSLGGYLTILSVLFTAVWVRKNPQSDVNITYEERTLFGCEAAPTAPTLVADQPRQSPSPPRSPPHDIPDRCPGVLPVAPPVALRNHSVPPGAVGRQSMPMPSPPWAQLKASE
ncbi:purM [Symbiodinium sp. CCMP2592]|nr:purM [Symbiodinium sp. CCMP2592]